MNGGDSQCKVGGGGEVFKPHGEREMLASRREPTEILAARVIGGLRWAFDVCFFCLCCHRDDSAVAVVGGGGGHPSCARFRVVPRAGELLRKRHVPDNHGGTARRNSFVNGDGGGGGGGNYHARLNPLDSTLRWFHFSWRCSQSWVERTSWLSFRGRLWGKMGGGVFVFSLLT